MKQRNLTHAEMFFRNPVLYCYVWLTNKIAQISDEFNNKRKGDD